MPLLVEPAILPGSLARLTQPTLETHAGISLRPWRRADVAAVVDAYNDPAIQLWHARSMTEDEARSWIEDWASRWHDETGCGWAIAGEDDVLGQISIRRLNLQDGVGDLSYWTRPAARGRGLASQSLAAVTTWAFGQLKLHRLELSHSTTNPASCRVAENARYVFEGIKRGDALHADGWHDMHLHARLCSDT